MYTGPPVAQQGVMGVSGIAAVSTVEDVKSSAAAEQIRDSGQQPVNWAPP